jgi:hypothetical protein
MLRIEAVQLAMQTDEGPFGFTTHFEPGLNILRAPNTMGKSTCLNSIVYALGLEGMFGPSRRVPLTDAVLRELEWEDRQVAVRSSNVLLEISAADGTLITLERAVVGEDSGHIIRVHAGPLVSAPDSYFHQDFHVRLVGSARNELGFHAFLAEALGLVLPVVEGASGARVPLYLECLLPFYFIDQLGWREVKARMPTYLGIPHMIGRACEFVLDLDVMRRSVQLGEAEEHAKRLRARWSDAVLTALAAPAGIGATVRGLSREPPDHWPLTPPPILDVSLGGEWLPGPEAAIRARAMANSLIQSDVVEPTTAAAEIEELRRLEAQLDAAEASADASLEAVRRDRGTLVDIEHRLQDLSEDLRQHEDELKIVRHGGLLRREEAGTSCSLCQQPLPPDLVMTGASVAAMSVEENVAFLRDQIATFRGMSIDARRSLDSNAAQASALSQRVAHLTEQLREHRRSLRADSYAPDARAIRARMQAEDLAQTIERASDRFDEIRATLEPIALEWIAVQGNLATLRRREVSSADRRKVQLLEASYLEQLAEYGFESYPIHDLEIGEDTYRPGLRGREMGLTSASDAIRSIWAYHVGLLEVARRAVTNHFGFLVFDEPAQQRVDQSHYRAMLSRVQEAANSGQQVIISTSHEASVMQALLEGIDCHYVSYDNRLIQPLAMGNPG